MSKYIDAEIVKQKYPDRRSLCEVMDEAEELDIYTAEQFREDMKLFDKMCGNTACSDCRFNSQSCDTFCMDLNTLRAWAEAERAKGGAENGKIEVYHRDSDAYKVCCSCDHRLANKERCDIDGHYIGYVDCFECWCRHWTDKEYKKLFDEKGGENK